MSAIVTIAGDHDTIYGHRWEPLFDQVDINAAWDFQLAVDGLRVPVYSCPSDPGSHRIRDSGVGRPKLVPTTYGFNMGTWFVFDPAARLGGDGVFFPNSHLSLRNTNERGGFPACRIFRARQAGTASQCQARGRRQSHDCWASTRFDAAWS